MAALAGAAAPASATATPKAQTQPLYDQRAFSTSCAIVAAGSLPSAGRLECSQPTVRVRPRARIAWSTRFSTARTFVYRTTSGFTHGRTRPVSVNTCQIQRS
jgi:hypothetical protein